MRWLFAHACPLCARRAVELVCCRCEAELACHYSGKTIQHPALPVHAWGTYRGLKRILELLKYDHQPELGDWLGERLGRWWLTEHPRTHFWVTAVPIHSTRLAERGYNQAECIARAFCRRTGLPYRASLVRTGATPALHGLGPLARRQVLESAFTVAAPVGSRAALLVDDIFTTGSTLAQCASVLKRAGSGPVEAVVVAHPTLRHASKSADT